MTFILPKNLKLKNKILKRLIAKMMDFFIVFFLAVLLPYPIGPLLGFFYSMLADGLTFNYKNISLESQSLGKKIMGLQVKNMSSSKLAHLKESALRNSPIGVATFFAIVPLWGWILAALVGIPLVLMEIYLMLTVEHGHRLGDVMADTEVIEL